MRRRWRSALESPRGQARAAWFFVGLAMVVVFVASWWRGTTSPGSGERSLTYLLDVLAIVLALISTLFEGRLANILGDFPSATLRRYSLLRVLVGVLAALIGCVVGAVIDADRVSSVISAMGLAVLAGGLTLMLNGIVRLALVDGANYASAKVQDRIGDDY
ncbi:MAG: hypothetical protein ACRDHN_09865 [Thermomicrobiales bacterium]